MSIGVKMIRTVNCWNCRGSSRCFGPKIPSHGNVDGAQLGTVIGLDYMSWIVVEGLLIPVGPLYDSAVLNIRTPR